MVSIYLSALLVTVAQVFGKNVYASDIGWPVLRHSRERGRENKGMF
jgi:hypothetical protein